MASFPSQSTFLSLMTSTASEAASYEFTTLTCIPGVIEVSWGLLAPGRGKGVCLCLRLCVCVSCTSVCVSEGWVAILAAKTPEMPGPSCSPDWFQESGQYMAALLVLFVPHTPCQRRSLVATWLDAASCEAPEP